MRRVRCAAGRGRSARPRIQVVRAGFVIGEPHGGDRLRIRPNTPAPQRFFAVHSIEVGEVMRMPSPSPAPREAFVPERLTEAQLDTARVGLWITPAVLIERPRRPFGQRRRKGK